MAGRVLIITENRLTGCIEQMLHYVPSPMERRYVATIYPLNVSDALLASLEGSSTTRVYQV